MSEFRRDLVERVFIILDRDDDGLVDINDMKAVYNAKRHPDVMNGKKSADACLIEFLETFE
jgi:Ca2+-binding EF-hand superfamily protein